MQGDDKTNYAQIDFMVTRILFDDAVRFFREKTDQGRCYSCGAQQWSLPTMQDDNDACLLISSGFAVDGTPDFVLTLTCDECGVLRPHRASFIKKWIESNPVKDSSDE